MKIPMEDWLRGCVYHDGRHGKVTLSSDKVIEVANYIQLTRTSLVDGMIELPPYDRKTELQTDYESGRQDALAELMEYTYGMLTTEKFGLQHKIKSMMADRKTELQTDYKMPYEDCEDCETHLKAQMQARLKTEPQTERSE